MRRGSHVLEVALTVPVYLIMLAGVVDYACCLQQRITISTIARDAARAASLVPLGAAVEPAGEVQGTYALQVHELEGTTRCTLSGEAPDQQVACEVSGRVEPWFGLLPIPDAVKSEVTFRMEVQP